MPFCLIYQALGGGGPQSLQESANLRGEGGGGGCFSFGVQTSGEYISTMFGCI